MDKTTRRGLFGAGAGLGLVATTWGINAAEAEANPQRMKLAVTPLRPIGVSMRHWPSSPALEARLTEAISDRNVELHAYADAKAVWLIGKADATHHTRFELPFEEMVKLEYMMRHGYLGTTVVDDVVADTDGSALPNAYRYTPAMYAKAERANADTTEPEYLPFWAKAKLAEMVAAASGGGSILAYRADDPRTYWEVSPGSAQGAIEQPVVAAMQRNDLIDARLHRGDVTIYTPSYTGLWTVRHRDWQWASSQDDPDPIGLSLPADSPIARLNRFFVRD